MTRGRKPKPRELKALEGNPGKRSLAASTAPLEPSEIPDPPAHLNSYAVEEWRRISDELARIGLISSVDLGALGAYCGAYATWRQAEEDLAAARAARPAQGSLFGEDSLSSLVVVTANGIPIKHPLLSIAEKAAADMVRYAVEFGGTPSSRARLGLDIQLLRKRGKSKFDGLTGEHRVTR